MPGKKIFSDLLIIVQSSIQTSYGLTVSFTQVPKPFVGDLDGTEIRIDPSQDPEDGLFTLIHLFGHTVQWNTNANAREVGSDISIPMGETQLEEIVAYEREASRFGIQLLHDIGLGWLDQWYSDFSAADIDYLVRYYKTGEKSTVRDFLRANQPLLLPLAIPIFHPTRWKFRWQGVVI